MVCREGFLPEQEDYMAGADGYASGKGLCVLGLSSTHRFPEFYDKVSGTFSSYIVSMTPVQVP